jgi:pyridoxal phosphate enzyme (YggS family)
MNGNPASVGERIAEVRARIERAARASSRSPNDITLIAVSKGFPAAVVEEALDAGVEDLGENRAHEFEAKCAAVAGAVRWHFVGRLQSNKVRVVVGACALIHSVDRPKVARAISTRARGLGLVQDVLVEVNVSGEGAKSGVGRGDAIAFSEEVAGLDAIRVRGLMTIPPWPEQPEDSASCYAILRDLRDELMRSVPEASELSMGMTRDFEVAVREGATLVRVGEAVFGPRPRP